MLVLVEIQEFFARNPKLRMTRLNPGMVQVHGDIGIHLGDYTFMWQAADGSDVEVDARYTFSYRREADGWKIVSHHSSAMPAAPAGLKAVSNVHAGGLDSS